MENIPKETRVKINICYVLLNSISNFPHFNLKFTIRNPTPTWVIFYWSSTDKSITDFPAHLVSQPFWIFPFARPTEVNGIGHQGVTIPVHKVGIGRWLRERICRLPGQAGVPESWPQEAISTHRLVLMRSRSAASTSLGATFSRGLVGWGGGDFKCALVILSELKEVLESQWWTCSSIALYILYMAFTCQVVRPPRPPHAHSPPNVSKPTKLR